MMTVLGLLVQMQRRGGYWAEHRARFKKNKSSPAFGMMKVISGIPESRTGKSAPARPSTETESNTVRTGLRGTPRLQHPFFRSSSDTKFRSESAPLVVQSKAPRLAQQAPRPASDAELIARYRAGSDCKGIAKEILPDEFFPKFKTPIQARGQPPEGKLNKLQQRDLAFTGWKRAIQIKPDGIASESRRVDYYQRTPKIILYRHFDRAELQPNYGTQIVPGPKFTLEKSAAWILGGQMDELPFVLHTNPTRTNLMAKDGVGQGAEGRYTIYAREICQLVQGGYKLDCAVSYEIPLRKGEERRVYILRPPPSDSTRRSYLTLGVWSNEVPVLTMPDGKRVTGASVVHNLDLIARGKPMGTIPCSLSEDGQGAGSGSATAQHRATPAKRPRPDESSVETASPASGKKPPVWELLLLASQNEDDVPRAAKLREFRERQKADRLERAGAQEKPVASPAPPKSAFRPYIRVPDPIPLPPTSPGHESVVIDPT